ncbi:MAG: flagellar basal body P-ring protein FlgI [Hyphomicrobiaceae bacterium]
MNRLIVLVTMFVLGFASSLHAGVRIKDVTSVQGVRSNQLVGYGLVIGLQGTGDSLRNAPFTDQSIKSMLDRMGVNVRGGTPSTRNVAAVIVTAELPPFIGEGSRIDVTIASLGDAKSLAGGSLIMTPLRGANDKIYAVAQGQVAVTGFVAAGEAESITQGVPTSGRIPNGAMVERSASQGFSEKKTLRLELQNPDFETAIEVTDAINRYAVKRYGFKVARERNSRVIDIVRPAEVSAPRFIAQIGNLAVTPNVSARVVVDERTGTIVIGQDVKIARVAVTHGNLTVKVTETPQVSQPEPFSDGETTVTPETFVSAGQTGGQFAIVQGTDLQTLVQGLNSVGLKPTGIIAILQAIKTAGALQAELVVQ